MGARRTAHPAAGHAARARGPLMHGLAVAHRWLGIGLCLLFAMWFASGAVMHFVGYPGTTEAERIARLPRLPGAGCCVPAAAALARTGIAPADLRQVRLAGLAGRPAYRFQAWSGTVAAVYADDGSSVTVGEALALAVAAERDPAAAPEPVALLHDDQWSVHHRWNPWRPLHRIRLGDAAGTEVYVSRVTGEIVRETTRAQRIAGWLGAVPHWLYPTVLRRHPEAWRRTVIAVSALGVAGAVSGIVLGLVRLRPGMRGASPYRGWHRLHHLGGLAAAVFLLAWIVSGLLSVNPGRWFPEAGPDRGETEAYRGGPLALERFTQPVAEALRARPGAVREAEWVQVDGVPFYRLAGDGSHLVPAAAGAAPRPEPRLPEDLLLRGARRAKPGVPVTAAVLLDAHDAYYYDPSGGSAAPLPVLRVTYADGTWLHADPGTGRLLEGTTPGRRLYRWLFDGLHRLDPPWLLQQPGLRHALVIALCLAGFAFSVTGVVLGWRRATAGWRGRAPLP